MWHTVSAAGIADGGFTTDDFCHFCKKFLFLTVQRGKGADIGAHLLRSAQSAGVPSGWRLCRIVSAFSGSVARVLPFIGSMAIASYFLPTPWAPRSIIWSLALG